jgi:hypothetical protein
MTNAPGMLELTTSQSPALTRLLVGPVGRRRHDRGYRRLNISAAAKTASPASSKAWFAKRCFEQWPLQRVPERSTRTLYVPLLRHGGPEHWAQELGVAFIARRPCPQCSQVEIRERLRALFGEHRPKRFPFQRWLREHGPRGLAEQIKRTGGARHCARELGVPGPQPSKWTDELIDADSGLDGLLTAVRRGHGSVWWGPGTSDYPSRIGILDPPLEEVGARHQ